MGVVRLMEPSWSSL